MDIAVAGCGPAGLATALLLDQAGHRVRLFERFDEPRPVGSGLLLQPTGLHVLRQLGLVDGIARLGRPIERLYGTGKPHDRVALDVRFDRTGDRPLAVHRAALFGALYGAVAKRGIDVATSVDVVDIERSEGGRPVVVDIRGRRHGPFDLLVDALGLRSPLVPHASGPLVSTPLHYGAFWANLPVDPSWSFDTAALEQRYVAARKMVGVLPVGRLAEGGEETMTFFWSIKPSTIPAWRQAGIRAWKDDVASLWPALERPLDHIEDESDLVLASYTHRTLTLPFGERLAFVGDCAHSTSPQLGQGANMALLDAAALRVALDANQDLGAALADYAAIRRWHVRAYQALSRAFTPFYQSDGPILPLLRDRLVGPARAIPGFNSLLVRIVTGMVGGPLARL